MTEGNEFAGATVFITGAAGNLGRAVARAFAARGSNLVLLDHRRDILVAAFASENDRRMFAVANLLEQREVDAAVAAAVSGFKRIDVLLHRHETSDQDWNFLFDLNARSLLNVVRAVVPRMLAQGGGKIVNVGAFVAQKGAAQMGAYVASKSVVIRLTESMAAELREKNINVNCVLPTIIDTPENRAAMPNADPSRWVAPDDLANVFLFLASSAARAIHGAALPVTGLS